MNNQITSTLLQTARRAAFPLALLVPRINEAFGDDPERAAAAVVAVYATVLAAVRSVDLTPTGFQLEWMIDWRNHLRASG